MAGELGWVALTVGLYVLARRGERGRLRGWGLVATAGALWVALRLTGTPPVRYSQALAPVTFLLAPATVALAVPLVRHWPLLAARGRRMVAAIAVGGLVSSFSAALLSVGVGLPGLWRTLLPHSATTPIALPLVAALGGSAELGAVATVLTGLIGSLVGPAGLARVGIRDRVAQGVALGTASSGIGTARAWREAPEMGAAAGLAMALSGVAIALLCLPFVNGRG